MANLAIKGHPTRGKEVIEILEMLGGKNRHEYVTDSDCFGFFIGNETTNKTIYYEWLCSFHDEYVIFTLEQFLEKFPYKVGDKVKTSLHFANCIGTVKRMRWEQNENVIIYDVEWSDANKSTLTYYAQGLRPYKEQETMDKANKAVFDVNAQCCDIMNNLIKEETMESKPNLLQQLKDYFDNTPRDVLEKEWHEYDKYNEIGPTVNEYLEYVNKSRQPEYPKTYEECCDVLGLSYMQLGVVGYKCETLLHLQQLLLYRDAYWKLAGDWKPNVEDEKQGKYAISNVGGKMSPEYYGIYNSILCFPTREIRDIFFETFKDVIEECKELL